MKDKIFWIVAPAVFAYGVSAMAAGEGADPDSQWSRSHASYSSNKFSSLGAINISNVAQLAPAWEWDEGGGEPSASDTVQVNPIIVDGSVFTTTLSGFLVSINALDGKENWRTRLPPPVGRRGLTYAEVSLKGKGVFKAVFTPTAQGIYAIDSKSGAILTQLGKNGVYGDNLSLVAPVITKDSVLTATMFSTIESFDLATGKKKWSTSLVKDKAYSYKASVWSGISYDAKRNAMYISTGDPGGMLVGIDRPGDNLYANSLVAIDTGSGKIKWHVQIVSHDLWDLDVVGPPILSTLKPGRKKTDVVIAVTKSGDTLVVNRDTGKFIFDNSYRAYPRSDLKGETAAKHQLHVDWPQSFSSLVFTPDMVTDISAEDHDYVMFKLRNARYGPFLPPSLAYSVALFGLHGGAEWPGAAYDPGKEILVVPSNSVPWILRLEYHEKSRFLDLDKIKNNRLYQGKCAACHGKFRQGYHGDNHRNDVYYPPLVGLTVRKADPLPGLQDFRANHQYVEKETQTVSENDLAPLAEYFRTLDSMQKENLKVAGFWQMVLDTNGLPGSKPPYGNLTAISLKTGKIAWQVPFGEYGAPVKGKKIKGQQNFGGAIITGSGVIFATGTVDNKIRAFNEENGEELWSYTMLAAGSAPPSTFMVNGEQYVVVNCTGGRYTDFSANKKKLIAFKLKQKQ